MRAEERHKIHRNELAEWLGEWNERIKPYSNVIFIAMLALAVGIAAIAYWVRQSRAGQTLAWEGYDRAVSTENTSELEAVAAQYSGTQVGQCAALSAADMYLAKGCQALFQNKSLAGEDLRKAVEHYRLVQDESRQPMLLAQACYGLARAYEALAGTRQSQGELQKAVEAYREVVDRWPNGPYAEQAARRLEDLQRHETKAFYDRFAQFEPQPARPQIPGAPGGSLPFDLGSLSEDGPLPGPTGLPKPDWTEEQKAPEPGEALQPDKPTTQGPSEPQAPSSQDPPGPEAPATSEPATAEETPDSPPAPAEDTPDPGPSPSTEPSEASP